MVLNSYDKTSKRGVVVVDIMNDSNQAVLGSILFIIKDDGRDIKYENACRMWRMNVVIEHASQEGLKKAVEEDYDMVVVDDYLGDKSGYTLSMEILNQKKVTLYMLGNDRDDISVIGAFRAGLHTFRCISNTACGTLCIDHYPKPE